MWRGELGCVQEGMRRNSELNEEWEPGGSSAGWGGGASEGSVSNGSPLGS